MASNPHLPFPSVLGRVFFDMAEVKNEHKFRIRGRDRLGLCRMPLCGVSPESSFPKLPEMVRMMMSTSTCWWTRTGRTPGMWHWLQSPYFWDLFGSIHPLHATATPGHRRMNKKLAFLLQMNTIFSLLWYIFWKHILHRRFVKGKYFCVALKGKQWPGFFFLEKHVAHIYMTAECIKEQYICEQQQVNCSWPSTWHSSQSKANFMVYIVRTHQANTNTISAEKQALLRLSATLKIHGLIILHTADS